MSSSGNFPPVEGPPLAAGTPETQPALPRPRHVPVREGAYAKHAIALVVALFLLLGLAVFAVVFVRRGARDLARPSTTISKEEAHASIASILEQELAALPRASAICGYTVTAVRNVHVGDVRTEGTPATGIGWARVTLDATPSPMVSIPVPGPCGATYRYQYAVARRLEGSTRTVEETHLTELQLARPLAMGTTLEGSLQAGDEMLSDGALMDDYAMELRGMQPVTVVVRGGPEVGGIGGNIDVMGGFFTVDGVQLVVDDDSAGNLNARVIFTPPADGTYLLRVTHALSGVHQGPYTIQTLAGAQLGAT